MKATPIISALLLPVLWAGTARAAAPERNDLGGEAGFFLGVLFPDEDVAGEQDPSEEFMFGGRVGVAFTPRWSWFVDGTYAEIDSATGFGTAEELTGRTGAEVTIGPNKPYSWFVNAGAGWVNFDYENGGAMDFHRPLGSVGAGQTIRWGPTKRIRWEWRGDVTLDDARLDGAGVFQGRFTVGLTWGAPRSVTASFGSPRAPTSTDFDGDGVGNRKDICQETPLGASVDKAGCPHDSDSDGIFDGIDRCPRTPRRARVDERGCIADSDSDGVHDGSDACPRTPIGAVVDEWGCATDRDGDRVPDGLDRCPQTPSGARVDDSGCPLDGDGDGVFDGLDRCERTRAGARVDRYGCSNE